MECDKFMKAMHGVIATTGVDYNSKAEEDKMTHVLKPKLFLHSTKLCIENVQKFKKKPKKPTRKYEYRHSLAKVEI